MGSLGKWVQDYLSDPTQSLPKVIKEANGRAWQCVELALVGDGLTGQWRSLLASGQMKAVVGPLAEWLRTQDEDFRHACLQQYRAAKERGLLEAPLATELDSHLTSFERLDNRGRRDKAWEMVDEAVKDLAKDSPQLAELLYFRTPNGPLFLILDLQVFIV